MDKTTPIPAPDNTVLNAQNSVLELVCYWMRAMPLSFFEQQIRQGEKAEAVGPLVHPHAWKGPKAFAMHSANLDILRTAQEFRRSLIAIDKVAELDPHDRELK